MELLVVLLAIVFFLVVLRPLGALTIDDKDMASAEAILREDYLPGVAVALGKATPALARIQRRAPELTGGDKAVMIIESSPNEAVGGREEDDDLPVPHHTSESKGTLDIPSHYGAFALSGKVIAAARRNPGFAINEIDRQMRGMKTSMKRFINHVIYRDGSGLIATCESASDAGGKTTIVVNNSLNNDGASHFRPGQRVSVLLKADGTVDDGVAEAIVDSVDESADSVTLDRIVSSAAGIDSTHGVYFYDSYNKVAYGFGAMLGDGNPAAGTDANGYYGGIDRTLAANYWFKGNKLDNGGVAQVLTVDLVLEGKQLAEKEDGQVTAAYMRPEVWRAWGNILWPSREWAGQIKRIDAGYSAFEYDGVLFVADWDCPKDQMLLAPETKFRLLELEALVPLSPDGKILRQWGRKDKWVGDVVWRFQMECSKPNAGTIIKDLAVRTTS